MQNLEKQPVPATKRKRAPANDLGTGSAGSLPLTVTEAAATGDESAILKALPHRLGSKADGCRNKRALASLAGQIASVSARIEALERGRRGQLSETVPSNEAVRRSLSEAAARGGGIRDELL